MPTVRVSVPPVTAMVALAGVSDIGLMTVGIVPVMTIAPGVGLRTETVTNVGAVPVTGSVVDGGTMFTESFGPLPVTVTVAAAGVITDVPAVDGLPPVIVIVSPVVTSDMVSVGAEPVTVISAPVRLPPGGVTIRSSFGAVPVTVAVAAAGVRTVVVTSVGAVPVTVTVAAAGVSVVVVAVAVSGATKLAESAHQPG